MNIIVCMKQVPDTEAQIRVKPDGSGIVDSDIKFVMNPYDEYGVEEALLLKEKFGGTVTIVCLGSERAIEAIRTGLAMGADKAVHLDDPAFEGGDAFSTAKALAAAIKGMEYDLIFCGKQAIDDDLAQVGPALAEMLGIPQIVVVTKVEVSEDGKKAKVNRQIIGGEEIIEVPLPAVLTAQKGLNEPRYASLPGIMKAKKKEVKSVKIADLGLDPNAVGKAGAKTQILKMYSPPQRESGNIIEGETAEETASKLATLLREEAKVI
ncbi:MAG: electron transfer flavoprotein subunit beta/FixA family protein [Deltaproteobacteria bacterium]|nr:electron transfer flavoprotein subunit beta/FixA family protein [Deltaproteobacteria bacterium]MCK5422764.1 electron transfer flavoprotein subunit beta/FixA family protein [Deltaproteobacteria bacterium]NOQ85716.1 electron transfer flavoprotein subunit beta [Deltaproteobacteria bacterium]